MTRVGSQHHRGWRGINFYGIVPTRNKCLYALSCSYSQVLKHKSHFHWSQTLL